jgi:hypothetical protein
MLRSRETALEMIALSYEQFSFYLCHHLSCAECLANSGLKWAALQNRAVIKLLLFEECRWKGSVQQEGTSLWVLSSLLHATLCDQRRRRSQSTVENSIKYWVSSVQCGDCVNQLNEMNAVTPTNQSQILTHISTYNIGGHQTTIQIINY